MTGNEEEELETEARAAHAVFSVKRIWELYYQPTLIQLQTVEEFIKFKVIVLPWQYVYLFYFFTSQHFGRILLTAAITLFYEKGSPSP